MVWLLKNPQFDRMPCQSFSEFVQNTYYLGIGDDIWRNVRNEGDIIWDKFTRGEISEACLLWGIGSGKSFLSAGLSLMFVHWILCHKNPHKRFGLNNDKTIAIINMGVNAGQAKNVVFASIKKFIENSPFFLQFKPEILSDEVRFYGKNITFYSGNSQETMPIGMNVFMCILDEAAWYLDNNNKSIAEDIYNTTKNRIVSRFGLNGFMMIISSVRYVDDFITRLSEQAKNLPFIHSSVKRTWEVKDREKMSEQTFDFVVSEGKDGTDNVVWRGIPIDFKRTAEANPEKFMRDFGCLPSLTMEAFDRDSQVVDRVATNRESPLNSDGSFKASFLPQDTQSRFVHIDLGIKHDSCGICMGKNDGVELVDGEKRTKVYIDLMMEIKALPNKEIQLKDVRQIIYDLQDRGFNITEVSLDQFQSADFVQILKGRGINAYLLSCDINTEPYDTLKELLHTRRINMYRDETFCKEYKRLELVRGRKVDHPQDGSKDVTDAVAGVCQMIVRPAKKNSAGFLAYVNNEKKVSNKDGYTTGRLLEMYKNL